MPSFVIGIILDRGREQSVDEGCLAQTRLACDLSRSRQLALYNNSKSNGGHRLTMIVKAAPLLATILCRWLGRLAMPIGEALSAVAGAMANETVEYGSKLLSMEMVKTLSSDCWGNWAVVRFSLAQRC